MNSFIKLRISGDGLNLQEITDQLGLLPSHTSRKGDAFISRWRHEKIIYQEDCWLAEHEPSEGAKLELEIEHFATQLKPSAAYLKSLSEKYNVTFWISAYPEGEQANVHITAKTIGILSELGATLDCSMAFLKEFYDGKY